MNNWEKFKTLSFSLSTLIIPVVVAYVGSNYNKAVKEREVQGKFVEIAVNILSEKPDSTRQTNTLREWATEIIDQYSGVKFTDEMRKNLIENISIPAQKSSFFKKYDLNDDDVINDSDFRLLQKVIGLDSTHVHYDHRFDFNNDGKITATDAQIYRFYFYELRQGEN